MNHSNRGPWGRLQRAAAALEDGLIVAILAAMILLAGAQIVLRNAFDTGLGWSDPLLRIMVLWLGLLGAMAATRDDRQISIDVLSRFLPPRARAFSRMITDLFTAAVCALIAYHAARFVMQERADGIVAFAEVPAWWCELILPIGFGVIALRCLFYLPRRMREKEQTAP